MKWELEDLSFKALHPGPYREIASLVERRRGERQQYVDAVLDAAETRLRESGVKAEVIGRPKHLYSIYEKMVIGGKEFNEIYDLAGVRILVDSVRDVYAALGAVHSRGSRARALQGLRRDAQEQHVPVAAHHRGRSAGSADRGADPHAGDAPHGRVRDRGPLALQGRTRRKKAKEAADLAWLGQMLEWLKDMADPREFMEGLKIDLYGGQVFCFTLKGDVLNCRPARRRSTSRTDPHRGGAPHDRRQGERQARAARLRAAHRRHRRGPDVEGPGRGPRATGSGG